MLNFQEIDISNRKGIIYRIGGPGNIHIYGNFLFCKWFWFYSKDNVIRMALGCHVLSHLCIISKLS